MKKFSKLLSILCAGAMVVSTFAFAACQPESNDDPNGEEEQPEVTLTLDKTTASVEAGQTVTINVTTNSDKAVTAASSSANATVTVSGKVVTVTGVTAGTATITVSVDGKNATCAITVTAAPEASLNLGAEYVVLEETYVTNDDTDDITTVELDVDYSGTGTIQATVADAEVATATYADGTVTLTGGTKFGKTTLTVTDGEKTATCTVEFVTFGLSYGLITLQDESKALEVADTPMRTSTEVYIPAYYYNLDADTYLPVVRIRANNGASFHDGDIKGGFQANEDIVSVYLGDNLTNVGHAAFYGAKALTEITTGPKLVTMGNKSFSDCEKLAKVNWAENGVIQELGQNCFLKAAFVEITVPKTVTKFNSSMFNSCSNLKIARLLGDAPEIFGGTFQACFNLEEVWFSKSIKTIGTQAFWMPDYENGWVDLPPRALKVVYTGTEAEFDAINISSDFNTLITKSKNSSLNITYNADFAALLAK